MSDSYSALATDPALRSSLVRDCRIAAIEFADAIDSTQRRARELAAADAPDWTLVVADYQTAGRGQHGRRWLASPGSSVMFSLIVRPRTPEAMALIPIRVGIAAAVAIESIIESARVDLKWPNDLIVDGRKLGGVLAEGQVRGIDLRAIVGVGINVRPFETDPDVGATPGYADVIAGRPVDRLDLLRAVAGCIRRSVDTVSPELSIDELARYAERDWLAGRVISEPVIGTVIGISETGALVVKTSDGGIENVVSGSVRL
jgi:BirA family transcriptional regulator, biotin operon repressor / biotin---[acetyl-CoA-carboxylase] ligase